LNLGESEFRNYIFSNLYLGLVNSTQTSKAYTRAEALHIK